MNRTLVVAAGALALLGAGAALRRSAPAVSPAAARAAVPEVPSALLPPAAPIPTRPEADRALKIARLLWEARSEEKELSASKERQARGEGEQLAQILRSDPGAWNDVLDLLNCLESPEIAVRVAGLLADAVDPSVERRLVEGLRSGASSQVRRVALALLGRRDSGDAPSAILSALDDPDPRLRQEVLAVLAERRTHPESAAAAATLDAALRRRAEADPDPNLRATCRAILGEATVAPSAPARRGTFTGASIGTRSTRSP